MCFDPRRRRYQRYAAAEVFANSSIVFWNVFKKKTGIESREHLDIVVGCAFGEAVVQENLLEVLGREFNPLEVGNADLFSDQRSNLVRAAQIADDVDMRMPLEIECIKGFRCDPGDVSWVNHGEGPIRNGEHITICPAVLTRSRDSRRFE